MRLWCIGFFSFSIFRQKKNTTMSSSIVFIDYITKVFLDAIFAYKHLYSFIFIYFVNETLEIENKTFQNFKF